MREYNPLTAALAVGRLENTSSVNTLCCGRMSRKSFWQEARKMIPRISMDDIFFMIISFDCLSMVD
jgi:hypothetical protein